MRKCSLGSAGSRGGRAKRHSPAQPRTSSKALGTRGGPAAGAATPSALTLLPPPPLPRGARHVGKTRALAGLGAVPGVGPCSGGPPPRPRSRPARYSAPRLQLPPGPCEGHRWRPSPARSGSGRPQGALALPDPRSGRRCRAGSAGCGCARRLARVLELATMCFATGSQMFLHI